MLAELYIDGRGVPINQDLAIELIKKAAELNEPSAQSTLGSIYEVGAYGVTQDPVQALSWYFKAAQAGNGLAQMKVGDAYFIGEGITKDVSKGIEYLEKAAAQNVIGAILSLALINKFGVDGFDSFVVDNEQSFSWYLKGAELGDKVCEYQVGLSFLVGDYVEIDDTKAATWLQKAADKGNADAMYAVGVMYINGRHFEQNTETAKHFYQQAADKGCEAAKQALDKLS
jgi:TPR repeat protein